MRRPPPSPGPPARRGPAAPRTTARWAGRWRRPARPRPCRTRDTARAGTGRIPSPPLRTHAGRLRAPARSRPRSSAARRGRMRRTTEASARPDATRREVTSWTWPGSRCRRASNCRGRPRTTRGSSARARTEWTTGGSPSRWHTAPGRSVPCRGRGATSCRPPRPRGARASRTWTSGWRRVRRGRERSLWASPCSRR